MRGKQLNSGIRGGLWDDAHLERMDPAVWLFGWLVHRQTRERFGVGLVLGGSPLTYEIIRQDTGMPTRTLKRWMSRLIRSGYVHVTHTGHKRMAIEIAKAKKFDPQQLRFPQQRLAFPQLYQRPSFFAPNSKGPHPALMSPPKGPNVALKNCAASLQVAANPSGYATAAPAHRDLTSERKQTEAPFASNGTPENRLHVSVSRHSYEDNASPKTPREQRVRGELRVGAGPEIHRE